MERKHYREEELKAAVTALVREDKELLSTKYRDHALTGQWNGFRELHIAGDWLLVYIVFRNELRLVLTRTGSHDGLFTGGIHVPDPDDHD